MKYVVKDFSDKKSRKRNFSQNLFKSQVGLELNFGFERKNIYSKSFILFCIKLSYFSFLFFLFSLSVSYLKICSVMHQLHNRNVSEKHLLIMVNCFSLKRYIFNKRNNCTVIRLMLLCYFTFHCLVDLILNYILWLIAKDFLSSD
jgi:hypothetical protein